MMNRELVVEVLIWKKNLIIDIPSPRIVEGEGEGVSSFADTRNWHGYLLSIKYPHHGKRPVAKECSSQNVLAGDKAPEPAIVTHSAVIS